MHAYYHQFTLWLHAHPQWGWVVAFFIAFAECIPLLGTVIPGSVTMTAIGVLVGSGVMPIITTLACATIGAVVGDSIGLFIGHRYKAHLKRMWPFRKYPQMLERGEKFIAEHGGKSIFIGRFVGAIRAFVPLVAGMLRIPIWRFYLVDVISAVCWAIAYMLPGFLIGIASLEIPAEMATKVILVILALLVILWLVTWVLHKSSRWIYQTFNAFTDDIWQRLNRRPKGHILCELLKFPEQKTESGQLALASFALILAVLFIIVWLNVIFHGVLTDWNEPFYHLFRGMHNPVFTHVLLCITVLGEKEVMFILGIALFLYFLCMRQWRTAIHWLALVILAMGLTEVFKYLHFNARPPGLFNGPNNSSFPSGHSVLSFAMYSFIAFLMVRDLPSWRRTINWCVFAIFSAVAISRLYLGAHWLTDIVGGWLLAATILCTVIIFYRRKPTKRPSWWGVLAVSIISIVLASAWFLHKNFHAMEKNYRRVWPHYQIKETAWWNQQSHQIPLYRSDRLGNPQQVLNIQWSAPLDNIIANLTANGWRNVPINNFFTLFERITQEDKVRHIGIIEELEKDKQPNYIGIRATDTGQPAMLFLWNANVTLEPGNKSLWVGAVYYQTKRHYSLTHQSENVETSSAIGELISSLTNYDYKEERIDENRLPLRFSLTEHSPYLVLLIRPKDNNILHEWQ